MTKDGAQQIFKKIMDLLYDIEEDELIKLYPEESTDIAVWFNDALSGIDQILTTMEMDKEI